MTKEDDNGVIRQLEADAASVLESIVKAKRDRPFFIEFSGTPKAGKTTIINSLRLFLNRNGYKVSVLVERASTAPIVNKLHMHFNVWTACQTLCQMLDSTQWPERNHIVILDRGLFDALAWMDWMFHRDALGRDEMDKVIDFLTLDSWRQLIDIVFIMVTTPEVSLEREYKDQVTKKPGRIMTAEALAKFNESTERTKETYGHLFRQMTEISTSNNIQPQETGREVVKTTLDTIRKIL